MFILKISILIKTACIFYILNYIHGATIQVFTEANRIDIALLVGLCGVLANYICDDIYSIMEGE